MLPRPILRTFTTKIFPILMVLCACRTTTNDATVKDATTKTPSLSGTLVVVSGQVHVLKESVWTQPLGNDSFNSDLQFYRGSTDSFFFNTSDPKGEQNHTFGWRFWNLFTGSVQPLVTGARDNRPYRFLASDADALILKNEHFKYTEVIMQNSAGRRIEHAANGQFLYNFLPDGTYSYIDWPSIGAEESKFFSNLVPGKQMLLKIGDSQKRETVVSAATAIMQPRFVDEGRSICYFKPGYSNQTTKEKSFLLECAQLDGTIRTFGSIRDSLNGSRLPPLIWSFEKSPFLIVNRVAPTHPSYNESGPIEVIDVRGGKTMRYNLGAGWTLLPQISSRGAGVELEPYVVALNRSEMKLRVLSMPDLRLQMQADIPFSFGAGTVKASFIPDK